MSTSLKLSIPKPCDAKWDEMSTEEKGRHCDLCSQSVYSLDEFEESEAVDLLQQRVCVRVKSNAKGQIKVRGGFSTMLLLGSLLACSDQNVDETEWVGEPMPEEMTTEQPVEALQMTAGKPVQVDLTEPKMGKIAIPIQETPSVEEITMGDVAVEHEELGEVVVEPTDNQIVNKAPQEDCMMPADVEQQSAPTP